MSATFEGSPDSAAEAATAGDPFASTTPVAQPSPPPDAAPTLGALPLGARLILRCRKDWRAASVAAFELDAARVVLSVASPSGHTYRLRRPVDSPLTLEGPIPVLGAGAWRPGLVRYDLRW